ncbi:Site-specific DNA-methyltransferase (adenine-specific) [Candidatus Electronema halotolerans]
MSNQHLLQEFVDYVKKLKGDEKGEAQLFCDRLFRAFGHGGIIEANGVLEARIKFNTTGRTKFADCLWSPPGTDGVLIEMKKKAEKNLAAHFPQVRDYWIEMNPKTVIGPGAQKPTYVILCNFDHFLIYKHLSLVDEISIDKLIDRASAFNFLLKEGKEPVFHSNVEEISQEAAKVVGQIFRHLIFERKEERARVQRFLLQSVLALFSEDFGLLPQTIFTELIRDCQRGQSTYDLFGGLFRQMASREAARGGRFKQVRYFNGGLFDAVEPLELDADSLSLLSKAAKFNWKHVNPAIFGTLFESTMNVKERHQFGAHFTNEADILKIVNPTIIRPWKEKLKQADTLQKLSALREELGNFKVLDPACGCGNFLYVAYRALKELEMQIIEKIAANYSQRSSKSIKFGMSRVSTKQFHGIDLLPVAVEVAKMTMMIGKELAADEWNKRISPLTSTLGLLLDEGLPLDRLEENIICDDALFCAWPSFDAVIGNPPYQSKNKMQLEMDRAEIERVRTRYADVPGRADYCVYWFRRAHEEMQAGQRAGLVGTNTIRQNYSREGGLDYIVSKGGTITEAVSTQVWSGDAAVHVSIVNWLKGEEPGKKKLIFQRGDSKESPFEYYEVEQINSALSLAADLTSAKTLRANVESKACFQGQTHGHSGFLLKREEAEQLIASDEKYIEVLFPFLTADEMIGSFGSLPKRYVIDFRKHDIFSVKSYPVLYNILHKTVYPEMKKKAEKEWKNTGKDVGPRQSHFKKWWKFWRVREELMDIIEKLPRYCVCGRVTKRPVFEFISSKIHPNDAIQVFPLSDDYSFGILQSIVHWEWFTSRCSTLTERFRYTSNSVFDSFPWPQMASAKQIKAVAERAVALRSTRRSVMQQHKMTMRDLYRVMEETADNPVSEAQDKLDAAVFSAYGIKKNADILSFLLALNQELAEKEALGEKIIGPGLPPTIKNPAAFITDDCVAMPE